MVAIISLFCFSCYFYYIFADISNILITTKLGSLRGKILETQNGKQFRAFTAIPYAKPPIGDLRFKPPVPAEKWDGVLDATRKHPFCPQIFLHFKNSKPFGEEDCLYLNVFTPQSTNNLELWPVMFYIHGGSWNTGSGNEYGGELLLDKDIVLVTINYRLGPLGFLTTGTSHAVGNDGLKDQVMALRWVKENIKDFGGNPEKITVVGHSSGAIAAQLLMLSPLSKDLISGVIAQSGSALSFSAILPHFLSTRRSKDLAENLGCSSYFVGEMMDCLKNKSAYEIVNQTTSFLEWDIDPFMHFKPVIEPKIPGAFLTANPIDIFKSKKVADVPFLTGITTDEGDLRTEVLIKQPDVLNELDTKFEELAPLTLQYFEVAARKYKSSATSKIKEFYFKGEHISAETKSQLSQMYSDALYLQGVDVSVELHSKFSTKPVYYYLFGYKGSGSLCSVVNSNILDYGVCHADDLFYLFKWHAFPNYKPTPLDLNITNFVITLWTNFVKYGNPTPEEDTTIPITWDPAKRGSQNYYFIKRDGSVELSKDLFHSRAQFWRNLELNGLSTIVKDEL